MGENLVEVNLWCIYTPRLDLGHVGMELRDNDDQDYKIYSFYANEILPGNYDCDGFIARDTRADCGIRTTEIAFDLLKKEGTLRRIIKETPEGLREEQKIAVPTPIARVYSMKISEQGEDALRDLWRQYSGQELIYNGMSHNCVHMKCKILNESGVLQVNEYVIPERFEQSELHTRLQRTQRNSSTPVDEQGVITHGEVFKWDWSSESRQMEWLPVGAVQLDRWVPISKRSSQ